MEFPIQELDFRFADEEDSQDIALLINRSLNHEIEGEESFRKENSSRITLDEIEANCFSPSTRWIVLETPRPEELLVAAARLLIAPVDGRYCVTVDIFGTANSDTIRNILLFRLEAICRSQGWNRVTFEVPSWSESIQNWLSTHGYEDRGGRAWPSERQDILLKPTMILEYQKSFDENSQNNQRSSLSQQLAVEMKSTEDEIVFHDFQIVDEEENGLRVQESSQQDSMKGLISDLFRALHAENVHLESSS